MKKIFKLIILSVLILNFQSCTEEKILDLSPYNDVSNTSAYSSPSLIEKSVIGMYEAAALGYYTGAPRGYIWGAAFVQQGDTRGEDVVNRSTFYQNTYINIYTPSTANNVYYWIDAYRLINRCNLVIEGVTNAISNGVITPEVGDNYIGQAKFLRAITHFELIIHFAQPYHLDNGASLAIPYREVGIDSQSEVDEETLKTRNTVAEVYEKVLSDLTDAENMITQTDLTKANKGAAIAFKTRVYLHKRDWDNVITEGTKLQGLYTLESTPSGVFENNYSNTESIFSIKHNAVSNPGVNAALASQYNRRYLVSISPIIWRNPSWLTDDLRRAETYNSDGTPSGMVWSRSDGKYTNKYKDVTEYSDAAPIIRYAEVVLNMAEAYARSTTQQNLGTARTLLNSLRDRALANPSTQTYTSAMLPDQSSVVGAILVERRIEFLMEGRRWADIHRLQNDDLFPIDGIPAKRANGSVAASVYNASGPYTGPYGVIAVPHSDYKFLWPIPQVEIDVNPNVEQNPGW